MDQYLEYAERLELQVSKPLGGNDEDRIRSALDGIAGAALVGVTGSTITIDRHAAVVSEKMIIETIEGLGLERHRSKKEGVLARMLRKMAESNQKEFGDRRLDCCDLPKD